VSRQVHLKKLFHARCEAVMAKILNITFLRDVMTCSQSLPDYQASYYVIKIISFSPKFWIILSDIEHPEVVQEQVH